MGHYFKIDVMSRTDGSDVINSDNILDTIMDNLDNELGYLFGKFLVPPASIIITGEQTADQNIMNREEKMEINDLEHQLETYEEEIFSKPGLDIITDSMFAKSFGKNELSAAKVELKGTNEATPSELNDLNLIHTQSLA